MKIANITCSFLRRDGIGAACRARAKGLLERGHEVLVIANEGAPLEATYSGFSLHVSGSTWLRRNTGLPRSIERQLRSADLLLVDFGASSPLHVWIREIACPIVLDYHGLTPASLIGDTMYEAGYLRAIGELLEMPKPDWVITHSDFARREYMDHVGGEAVPSSVIPLFGCTRPLKESIASSGIPNFLCLGRLYPNKNYECAIAAIDQLNRQGFACRLTHVGSGGDSVARGYARRLKKLVGERGVPVTFAGSVEPKVLDQYLADCSAVIIPSLHEGFSLPAVEGLMHGKPVFASQWGALPETLADAAIYFHPFDPAGLANAIRDFFRASSDTQTPWRERCRRRFSELTESRFVESFEQVLKSVNEKERSECEASGLPDDSTSTTAERPQGMHFANLRQRGTRLIGRLFAPRETVNHVDELQIRAAVTTNGVLRLWPAPLSGTMEMHSNHATIDFKLQLCDAPDWSHITFVLYDHRLEVPLQGLSPCVVARSDLVPDWAATSVGSVSAHRYAIRSFASREIQATEDCGWLFRIKSRIANSILSLVHHALVGPQAPYHAKIRSMRDQIEDANRD